MSPETVSEESAFGAGVNLIEQLSWKELVDVVTCTERGWCQSQCSAWATGKSVSAKLLVMSPGDEEVTVADICQLLAVALNLGGALASVEAVESGAEEKTTS